MRPTSFVVAVMVSILAGVTAFACAAPGPADDDTENVGQAQEAICKDPPCGPTRPPPPPPTSQPINCSGVAGTDPTNGQTEYWTIDCSGRGGQPYGVCECLKVELPPQCSQPGVICNGFSVISTYTCPTLFPYLRCSGYASCTCNAYPN